MTPDVIYLRGFLSPGESDALLERIRYNAEFRQNYIQLFGRKPIPRLEAWYGSWDYPYSRGITLKAAPMPDYLQAVIDVLSQSVACNRLHLVSERCARWLLMSADRVHSPDFPLTHEALATMLGVRRAGVSVAAAALQSAGYLSYRRGRFHMIDSTGLESAACECYGVTRAIYDRTLPTVPA